MGAKSEELARQVEAKSRGAIATLEKLSDADWSKVTAAEKWSVGVTAHHMASVLEPICAMIWINPTWRSSVLLPAMFGPVRIMIRRLSSSCTLFGMNSSRGIMVSTTGWRPARMFRS